MKARLSTPVPLLLMLSTVLVAVAGCSRRDKAERFLASADRYYDARQFEKAKVEYQNVLRRQPTNSQAILRLGKVFFRQGQLEEAYPFLNEGKKRFPEDLETSEQLAVLYLGAGQLDRARAEALRILGRQPTNAIALGTFADSARTSEEAAAALKQLDQWQQKAGDGAVFHIARAQIAFRQQDTNSVERELRRALALEPQSVLVHRTLGIIRWSQGATNEVEKAFRTAARLAPADDIARISLAGFLLGTGRLEEADTLLEEINREAPERTAAWAMRAEIALRQAKLEECGRLLDRAFGQAPNDLAARLLQAQLRLAQKKPADAVRLLKSAAERRPRSGQVQYQLGIAQMANEELGDAAASLAKAVAFETNNVGAALMLAELNLARGQTSAAVATLADLTRRLPSLERAQFLLARAYAAAGRPEEALRVYRTMRTRFPENPAVRFQLGLLLRLRRDGAAESRKSFEEARRLAPDDLGPLEQLIAIELAAKLPAKALALLQPELDRKPQSAPLWLLRGQIHLAEQDRDGAEAALKKAIGFQPEFQPAYLMLADLYLRTDKPKESLQRLADLLKHDPKNLTALTLIGIINAQLENFDDAQRAYEQALKVNPNFVLALNNQAYLLAEVRNRLDEALVQAKKARQLAPADPRVADTLGWIEHRRGNYPEALRLLTEAQQKLAGQSEIEAHLGLIRYMMGQEEAARSALAAALGTPGKFPGRDLVEQRLAILDLDAGQAVGKRIETLERRRQEDPDDLVAVLRLGKAREAANDPVRAREAYEAVFRLNPAVTEAVLRLADLETEHNPARALQLARQAQQLAPNDPEVDQILGRLALRSGDTVAAYGLLAGAARQLGTRPDVWFDLAGAAFGTGRLGEAADAMRTAAQLGLPAAQGNSAQTFLALLASAQNPTSAASAQALVDQVLKADPMNGPALFAQGLAHEQRGRFAEARDAHEKLLQRYPAFMPAVRQLAILYAERLNNDAKAYELATQARTALPKDDLLADTLGQLAFRRGDHRYAVQLFAEVARSQPKDADVQFRLGLAYRGLKQVRDCRAALERAIALDPKGAFVPEARKILAEKKAV